MVVQIGKNKKKLKQNGTGKEEMNHNRSAALN